MTVARKPPTVWFTVRGFPFHVPRAPRRFFGVSGEDLRQAFESRLRSREPIHEEAGEVPAEPAAGPASGAVSNGHSTGQKPAAAA